MHVVVFLAAVKRKEDAGGRGEALNIMNTASAADARYRILDPVYFRTAFEHYFTGKQRENQYTLLIFTEHMMLPFCV
jgi:hypothetical protein